MRLRRALGCAVFALLSVSVAFGRVHADLDHSLLESTRALFALDPGVLHGEPRDVLVNGASLRVATGQSELPLPALLDHFVRKCREDSGGLAQAAQELARREHVQEVPSLADGVLRVETSRDGLVACLGLGAGPFDGQTLAARLVHFAKDGDLSVLGGVRLVRASQHERGTFFVATHSEGAVPLWHMFPATGDAPGVDLATVARPHGARRMLSAWQRDAATGLAVYESPKPRDVALEEYASQLERERFVVLRSQPGPAPLGTLFVMRAGHAGVVSAMAHGQGSLLTVMALDAGPGAVSARF